MSNWQKYKNKYDSGKNKVGEVATNSYKKIKSNKVYTNNLMLIMAALLIFVVYAGTLNFDFSTFAKSKWWIKLAVTGICLTTIFTSLISVYGENRKQEKLFTAMTKQYTGQVFCANNNQDNGTIEGVKEEVDLYNKELMERVWRKKLQQVTGSLYNSVLKDLNANFNVFFSLTDEIFNKFFEDRKINRRQQNKIMKVVYRIRSNDYKVKKLITVDDLLYDTFNTSETVTPVFNEQKETSKGILYRFISYIGMSAIFAVIFIDKMPNAWGIIVAIITASFSIFMTIMMASNKADVIHKKRTNALKKRLCMLEGAFNRCKLDMNIRSKYYTPVLNDEDLSIVTPMSNNTKINNVVTENTHEPVKIELT